MNNFDAKREVEKIETWIRDWFANNGPKNKAIIGISGGKDSTIVAKLLVDAIGKDRVIGVMMPNGVQKDISDSERVIELLGIERKLINIAPACDAELNLIREALGVDGVTEDVNDDVKINIPPRIRMTTLYGLAPGVPGRGMVVNTCNASEDFVGYSTKFGDSAGDFSPCRNYLVTEMLQIGDALGLPYDLIHKVPSDGLCGKTDEDNLGFTYAELDNYILTGKIDSEEKTANIDRRHRNNLHKLKEIDSCPRDNGFTPLNPVVGD